MNASDRDDRPNNPKGDATRRFRVLPGSVRIEASAVAVPLRRLPECTAEQQRSKP